MSALIRIVPMDYDPANRESQNINHKEYKMDLNSLNLNDLKDGAVTDAEGDVKKNLGKAVALLTAELQRQSNGDPFALQKLTDNLVSGMQSGQGFAATPKTDAAPAAALPAASPAPQDTEFSEAEKQLLRRLLAISGTATEADRNLDFVEKARKADPQVLPLLADILHVTSQGSKPERVVREGDRLMLASQRDALRRAEEFERIFWDLLSALLGGSVPVDSSSNLLRDGKAAIAQLKRDASATSEDVFLRELARVAGVAPMTGETFASYVARVVTDLNKKAGITAEYSSLLNEVGAKINVKRNNGEADSNYRTRLLTALQNVTTNAQAYWDQRAEMVAIATRNGMTVKDTDLFIEIVNALIADKGGYGGKIKP